MARAVPRRYDNSRHPFSRPLTPSPPLYLQPDLIHSLTSHSHGTLPITSIQSLRNQLTLRHGTAPISRCVSLFSSNQMSPSGLSLAVSEDFRSTTRPQHRPLGLSSPYCENPQSKPLQSQLQAASAIINSPSRSESMQWKCSIRQNPMRPSRLSLRPAPASTC